MAKFNLEFSDQAAESLTQLAKDRRVSKTDVVREALNVYAFLEKRLRSNARLFIESSTGEKTELVLPHAFEQ
jgi:hypothetical protein